MEPGKLIRLATAAAKTSTTTVLIKTDAVEVIQLVIPADQTIPTYEAQGEIVIHCLAGHVSLAAMGKGYELASGQLLYLLTKEPFSATAKEDSSLLVTMIAHGADSGATIGESRQKH